MAISAEPTNSGSLLIESAHPAMKGFATSCVMIGIFAGFLLGILSFYLLSISLTVAEMTAWGWRLSFLIFAILGLLVALVLTFTKESPLFLMRKEAKEINHHPLRTAFTVYPRQMFTAFGYSLLMAVCNYFLLGYISHN